VGDSENIRGLLTVSGSKLHLLNCNLLNRQGTAARK
jgi:hypothetical protein